eukprot:763002-Hanusia_phi.AAC.2
MSGHVGGEDGVLEARKVSSSRRARSSKQTSTRRRRGSNGSDKGRTAGGRGRGGEGEEPPPWSCAYSPTMGSLRHAHVRPT